MSSGTRRRLVAGALACVLVLAAGLWVWWTAPRRGLAAQLDRIELPAELRFLGEHVSGNRLCLFDACDRLTRWYGSDLTPSELCDQVGVEFDGAEGPLTALPPCSYTIDGVYLGAGEPIETIPPDDGNELVERTQVSLEHNSTLTVSARR